MEPNVESRKLHQKDWKLADSCVEGGDRLVFAVCEEEEEIG
jgi:hypothetical protein